MVETIIICTTVLGCVALISKAHWTVTINQVTDAVPQQPAAVPDIDKVYEQLDKEDPVPNFADVINAINKEFGGVNDDEQ